MTGRDHQNDTATSRQRAWSASPCKARLGFQFLTFLLGLALVLAGLWQGGLRGAVGFRQRSDRL